MRAILKRLMQTMSHQNVKQFQTMPENAKQGSKIGMGVDPSLENFWI